MMTSSAHKFSVYPFHLIGLHAAVLEESDVFTLTLTLTLTLTRPGYENLPMLPERHSRKDWEPLESERAKA